MQVLVIGDPILDFTRYGTSCRRSPESARCVVLEETRQEWTLGGAANVARWLAADPTLNVTLIAPHGRDDMSVRLRSLCQEADVRLSARLFDPALSVTVKERLLLENPAQGTIHHLLRVDRDVIGEVRESDFPALRHDLWEYDRWDAVVAVDYAKFTFRSPSIVPLIGRMACPIIVNSKQPDIWREQPCHLLLCNQQEMVDSFGVHEHVQARRKVRASCFVVTRGAGGVTAVLKDDAIHRPSVATEIVDVCGAGDAFTAGLAQAALYHTVRGLERLQPVQLVDLLDAGLRSAAWCCSQVGVGTPLVPGKG